MLLARRLLLTVALLSFLSPLGCTEGEVTALPAPPRDWGPSDYVLEVAASAAEVSAGEAVTFTASLTAPTGEDVSDAVAFATEMSPSLGAMSDGDGQYRFASVGTYTWFVSVEILGSTRVGSASVVVRPGPAAIVDLSLAAPIVEAGVPLAFRAEVFDAYGNSLPEEQESLVYSASPSLTIADSDLTAIVAGNYIIKATLADGSAVDSEPLSVLAGPPGSLSITLSSYDVERGQGVVVETLVEDNFGNVVDHPVDLSAVPGGGVEAWGNFVRFHDEGLFQVHADITDYGLHAEDGLVLVDSSGPLVRLTYPPRGAELERQSGEQIQVTGLVSDSLSGVASLSINGEAVSVDPSGAFAYDMNADFGLNTLHIESLDGDDNHSDLFQTFLWGDYTPQGQPHQDAILARLNEGAIDGLEEMVEGLISGGDITSALEGSVLGPGLGGGELVLSGVTLGNPTMDLDPQAGVPEGHLNFFAEFSPLSVSVTHSPAALAGDCISINLLFTTFTACGYVWFSATGSGGADEIWVDTDVQLEADPVEVIDVTISNTTMGVDGSDIDIDTDVWLELSGCGILCSALESVLNLLLGGFTGAIDLLVNGATALFSGLIDSVLASILPGILESELAPLLEDALDDLMIETQIDLMGVAIDLEALPQDIEIDDDGMLVALESVVSAPQGPSAPPTLGALYDVNSLWPVYPATEDLHLSMEDGFVNQLLHSAWQGGVMNMTMDASSLGLDLSQVAEILPLTYLELAMVPLLPPVVGPAPAGGMSLAIGDLLINVNGDPGGVSGLMMQLAVTVVADADFTLDAEGNIQFGFANPTVHMDFVTSSPWVVDGELVENVMDAVVDLLIPTLMDTLGGLGGFAMPELGGFGLSASTFEREPAPAAYITMSGELSLD